MCTLVYSNMFSQMVIKYTCIPQMLIFFVCLGLKILFQNYFGHTMTFSYPIILFLGRTSLTIYHNGSVVECLIRDLGAAGSSLSGATVLWSLSKTHLS